MGYPVNSGFDDAVTAVPNDSVVLSPIPRGLWVGGAGNVKLVTPSGNTVVFTAVPAGTLLPIQLSQLLATGTTATLMLLLK